MALAVPLSRFTSRVGGGSASFVRRHPTIVRFISLILAVGFLAGCAANLRDQLLQLCHTGMSREELHAQLASSRLLLSASRPIQGWSGDIDFPTGSSAGDFERLHAGIVVQICDVYWVGHTNNPKIYNIPKTFYFGRRLDYFYFDEQDRLVGFERWTID